MSDTNFQPIFDYIDQTKKDILDEMPSKSAIEKLQNSVDSLTHKFDKLDKESVVGAAKLERVEHWVIQAAEKVEAPYKP